MKRFDERKEKEMKMKKMGMAVVGTLCAFAAFGDLAEFVDPFVGTSATGHTFPGACVPFGMVQASPDSRDGVCPHGRKM